MPPSDEMALGRSALSDGTGFQPRPAPHRLKLNRVHFENHGYVGPQSRNAPVRGASAPNCRTTVSKVDAV